MAALLKRERGAWKVTFPASTRRSGSSSSPSYHTWRLLLASNSRWLSKSTFRCRRCPTTPPERIEYCGLGLMVGKPAAQPDRACCSAKLVGLELEAHVELHADVGERPGESGGLPRRRGAG